MSQAWAQVAGLVFDILGFGLIAWEWLLAQRAEGVALAIEDARERQEASMANLGRAMTQSSPAFQRHVEMTTDSQRRMAKNRLGASRAAYARHRYGAVYAGMALVLAGFVLQLVGTLPGCCAALGLIPGGP